VALITASANWESKVSDTCLAAALRFAEWQEKVREVYSVGVAENPDAMIATAIIDACIDLKKAAEAGKPITFCGEPILSPNGRVHWRLLSKKHNWSRKYGPAITRCRNGLVDEGILETIYDEDTRKATGYYSFRGQGL
jgi:hypothetical protein